MTPDNSNARSPASDTTPSGSAVTRRELLRGATALGAAASLGPATAFASGAANEMIVGTGKRIITPDPLLPISGGMGLPHPAHAKQGELTARAVYIRRGDVGIAIVSLDLLGFPSVLGDRVRARVPRIPAGNIMIGSTHTHSAPDCYAFPIFGKGSHTGDLKYMDHVSVLAAEAVNEAIDSARPAVIRAATDIAHGKISYNYYAPDLCDHRMTVLQARASDGKPIATLVNYAIHPEVMGSEQGILCPDLCGPLYDRLEERAGGMAIFVNGAQGGMITADNRILDRCKDPLRAYWQDSRTWDECLRIGGLMADEAVRIIEHAPDQPDASLYCRSEPVTIPVASREMWEVVLDSALKYPHGTEQKITIKVNLVNIGSSQIVTCPGEALPNIGFYVKRKMRGANNMFFGLTNDAFGYILTKVDFHSFPRYEYCSQTSLGEMTGEILMEKWLEMVRTSPVPA